MTPLERVGCYVPGGRYPLPSSLLMTAIPAQRRRRAGDRRGLPEAGRDRHGRRARSGRDPAAAPRRRARDRGAGLRHGKRSRASTRSSGPATRMSPPRRRSSRPTAPSTSSPGPSEILVVSTNGRPAWIAADLLAQAEHDEDARAILVTPSAQAGAGRRRRDRAADAARRAGARRHRAQRRHRRDPQPRRGRRAQPAHGAGARRLRLGRRSRVALTRAGTVFVGHQSAQACGDYITGSNHVLPTSGAARGRGGLERGGLRARDDDPALSRPGLKAVAPHAIALAEAEGLRGHAASIRIRGVRLMQTSPNENTAGCSPAVLDDAPRAWPRSRCRVLSGLRHGAGRRRRLLRRAGRSPGADERPGRGDSRRGGRRVPRPLEWDRRKRSASRPRSTMYEICTTAVGGRMVTVPLDDEFELVRRRTSVPRVTPRTRIVFVTNPHNPSGRAGSARDPARRSRGTSRRSCCSSTRRTRTFSGETLIDPATFAALPNLVVGRTFSKAYGLAGLRVGVARRRSRSRSRRCAGSSRPTA